MVSGASYGFLELEPFSGELHDTPLRMRIYSSITLLFSTQIFKAASGDKASATSDFSFYLLF